MNKDTRSAEPSLFDEPAASPEARPNIDITDKIDELESLIADSNPAPKLPPQVPILTDFVDPDEIYKQPEPSTELTGKLTNPIEDFPQAELDQLVAKIDQNLSKEIDSLIETLKGPIKDSIIEELKEQLKKEATQTDMQVPGLNNPDKSPE